MPTNLKREEVCFTIFHENLILFSVCLEILCLLPHYFPLPIYEYKYYIKEIFIFFLFHLKEEEEISTSPGVSEFVSDAFDACSLNREDLRKEIEQLVLDKKKEETTTVEGKMIVFTFFNLHF